MGGKDNILVIDDRPTELRLIEEVVDDADVGVTLHTATGKKEAQELFQREIDDGESYQPDTVIVDWNLEKETGQDILEAVEWNLDQVKVVIMSSTEHRIAKLRNEVPQADEYFTKPSTAKEYTNLIQSLID